MVQRSARLYPITDTTAPDQVIPLLNDYAEAVISAIHDHGGDVLKLIGDGTLAIFTADTRGDACRRAVGACGVARQRSPSSTSAAPRENLPVTDMYLGLHIGEVFYGNIGSAERLDFTVVGPAVNEAARIAAMCRSAERNVLLSAGFRRRARRPERARLVSVGRYALRGVARPRELFTIA